MALAVFPSTRFALLTVTAHKMSHAITLVLEHEEVERLRTLYCEACSAAANPSADGVASVGRFANQPVIVEVLIARRQGHAQVVLKVIHPWGLEVGFPVRPAQFSAVSQTLDELVIQTDVEQRPRPGTLQARRGHELDLDFAGDLFTVDCYSYMSGIYSAFDDFMVVDELHVGDALDVWLKPFNGRWLGLRVRSRSGLDRSPLPAYARLGPGASSHVPQFATLCVIGEEADEKALSSSLDDAMARYEKILETLTLGPEPDAFLLSKTVLGMLFALVRHGQYASAGELWQQRSGPLGKGVALLDSDTEPGPHDRILYAMLSGYLASMTKQPQAMAAFMNDCMLRAAARAHQTEPHLLPNIMNNWKLQLHEMFGDEYSSQERYASYREAERRYYQPLIPLSLRWPAPARWIKMAPQKEEQGHVR